MPTVREATFELFRAHGMTTVFGNPGSTELPMLADFPADFTYVLGLQELVGGRDGRRLRAGERAPDARQPAHRARSRQRRRRDLQRPGQQVAARDHRRPAGPPAHHDRGESDQPGRDPRAEALREVGHEPRARRTSPTRSGARSTMRRCRRGDRCSSRSRWTTGARRRTRTAPRRRVRPRRQRPHGTRPRRAAAARGAARRARATRCSSRAPTSTPSGGWDAAVALAEKQRLPVWASPATGGNRLGFPEAHATFAASCRPRSARSPETLEGHDLVLVAGSSVFPYYPYIPGPLLPEGAALVAITSDPGEAARAPMGDAIVGDVGVALQALVELVGDPRAPRRAAPAARRAAARDPMSGSEAMAALKDAWPDEGIAVLECPPRRSRCATVCGCPSQAATTSARAAAWGSGSRPRSECSSPSRAAGRVRARRGLGAVRDHGAVDGGRLQGARHLPGAAQRGVHDPQVVRSARAGRRACPGSTCRGWTSRRLRPPTGYPRAR